MSRFRPRIRKIQVDAVYFFRCKAIRQFTGIQTEEADVLRHAKILIHLGMLQSLQLIRRCVIGYPFHSLTCPEQDAFIAFYTEKCILRMCLGHFDQKASLSHPDLHVQRPVPFSPPFSAHGVRIMYDKSAPLDNLLRFWYKAEPHISFPPEACCVSRYLTRTSGI